MTTPATIQIQVGNLIFDIPTNHSILENDDYIHFTNIKNDTLENMNYFRDYIRFISKDDLHIFQICIDWYFYILEYGLENKYDDYMIFLDLNEYYMNEVKKKIDMIKEITITIDPDEFKIMDQIFIDMQDTLNHLKDQDRIRFDIGEMMTCIFDFVENYFNPF